MKRDQKEENAKYMQRGYQNMPKTSDLHSKRETAFLF